MKTLHRVPSLLVGAILFICTYSAPAAEVVTYYHLDALGSPVAASNAQGQITWREQYKPYGERLQKDPASQNNPRWYTGHPEDPETGLTYAGARYYDPVVGRFMGVDPKGFSEGNLHSFNRYGYGNDNPYRYADPDGNSPVLLAPVLVGVGLFLLADYANAPTPGETPVTMSPAAKVAAVAGVLAGGTAAGAVLKGLSSIPTAESKPGSAESSGAGKLFPEKVKEQAREESSNTCVFCGTKTTQESGPGRSEIDHAIPKSRGGDNSLSNAQNTCRDCNRAKGTRTTEEFLR